VATQKVYNHLLGEYKVKATDNADGKIQHVALDDGSGSIIVPAGAMVTLTHTRPSCATATSTTILAANPNRKPGGWVQNNTTSDFWLEIAGAAVASQGIYLGASSGIYYINTQQEIRAIQSSGGSLAPDVYEAT